VVRRFSVALTSGNGDYCAGWSRHGAALPAGMNLDYSDALIGGGFQFQNPNATDSCGCGKSFGV